MGQTEQAALGMLEEMADRLLTASTDGELITDPDAFEINEELRLIIDKLREEQPAPAVSPDVPQREMEARIPMDYARWDYVAWLRYARGPGDSKRIVTCDSDEPGAFKVFRHPAPVAASPSAGAQHHVFCNFQNQPIGGPGCICVVTYKRHIEDLARAAASPDVLALPQRELTQPERESLKAYYSTRFKKVEQDVLARIEGLIAKWREPHGMCQVYYDTCADELDALRDELAKGLPQKPD